MEGPKFGGKLVRQSLHARENSNRGWSINRGLHSGRRWVRGVVGLLHAMRENIRWHQGVMFNPTYKRNIQELIVSNGRKEGTQGETLAL